METKYCDLCKMETEPEGWGHCPYCGKGYEESPEDYWDTLDPLIYEQEWLEGEDWVIDGPAWGQEDVSSEEHERRLQDWEKYW